MTRIALITGGSRGLGRATALALADSGVDVLITYRTGASEAADVVAAVEAAGRRAVALPLETTDLGSHATFADAVRSALRDVWSRDTIDVLVNNAGSSGETPLGATDADEVQRLFDVHVLSVVMLTQELLPLIADGGRILNVSTGLTVNLVNPAYSVYAAMKGAVEVYSRYLATSLGSRGIAGSTCWRPAQPPRTSRAATSATTSSTASASRRPAPWAGSVSPTTSVAPPRRSSPRVWAG